MADGKFRIPELDFSYTLPTNWTISQRPPAPDDEGTGDTLAERLLDLWESCARDVLHATPATNGAARLQLRVLDQACFGLPAPASVSDSFGSESLGRYLEMLGRFGQIKSNRLVESGDRLFSVYESTVPSSLSSGNLEQRDAESDSGHALWQAALRLVLDCSHNVRADARSELAGAVWKWPSHRDRSRHAHLENLISTVICTGSGWPSFFAGLKRQVFTVATALFSNTGAELRTTCTGPTCPRVSTPINITTTPLGSVSAGRSG